MIQPTFIDLIVAGAKQELATVLAETVDQDTDALGRLLPSLAVYKDTLQLLERSGQRFDRELRSLQVLIGHRRSLIRTPPPPSFRHD